MIVRSPAPANAPASAAAAHRGRTGPSRKAGCFLTSSVARHSFSCPVCRAARVWGISVTRALASPSSRPPRAGDSRRAKAIARPTPLPRAGPRASPGVGLAAGAAGRSKATVAAGPDGAAAADLLLLQGPDLINQPGNQRPQPYRLAGAAPSDATADSPVAGSRPQQQAHSQSRRCLGLPRTRRVPSIIQVSLDL